MPAQLHSAPLWPVAVVVVGALSGLVAAALPPCSGTASPDAAALGVAASDDVIVRAFGVDRFAPAMHATGWRAQPPWSTEVSASRLLAAGLDPSPRWRWTPAGSAGGWTLFDPRHDDADTPESMREPTPTAFGAQLRRAQVSILHEDGTARACDRWVFGRWICGPEPWHYVGVTEVAVRGRQERCIWAHPHSEGTLRIAFPGVGAGTLTGRHGLSDVGATSDVDGDVPFVIRVGDEVVETRNQTRRSGFTPFRVRLEHAAPATLAFEVGNDVVAQRHFCFEATLQPLGRSPRAHDADAAEGEDAASLTDDGSAPDEGSAAPTAPPEAQ